MSDHKRPIFSRFRPKRPPLPPLADPDNIDQTPLPDKLDISCLAKTRTRERYVQAATLLKQAIETHRDLYGSFDFEELGGEPEGFDDFRFLEKINMALESRKSKTDEQAWFKIKKFIECIFITTSPFAKNFLTIAKEGQSVPTVLTGLI
jgi:hypothetical protein